MRMIDRFMCSEREEDDMRETQWDSRGDRSTQDMASRPLADESALLIVRAPRHAIERARVEPYLDDVEMGVGVSLLLILFIRYSIPLPEKVLKLYKKLKDEGDFEFAPKTHQKFVDQLIEAIEQLIECSTQSRVHPAETMSKLNVLPAARQWWEQLSDPASRTFFRDLLMQIPMK